MPSRIIAVANQKGGVGKTTTAVNVSACIAAQGRRVLLLDLDAQANATSGLGMEKESGASAYAALLGDGNLEDQIKETPYQNLHLIPSEMDLCGADVELNRLDNHLQRLTHALDPIRNSDRFDLVLIDCPPSLGVLTLNAFAASEGLLVPLQCEYYALEGVAMLNKIVDQLRDGGINPNLGFLGIVMTMFDGRTRLGHQVIDEIRNHFGDFVFDTVIPRSTRLAEAPSHGKPIMHYDQYNAGSAAYEVLSQEIANRLWGEMKNPHPTAEPADKESEKDKDTPEGN